MSHNQNLFNKLSELGIIALQSEMHEIKEAVKKDEQEEWEEEHRRVYFSLEEDEPDDDPEPECEFCGRQTPLHYSGCIYNNPLAFNEVGYD